MTEKQEYLRAWNAANSDRKRELTRRGNRALYWRQKALADICKSVAAGGM